jgi:hypothetical protein
MSKRRTTRAIKRQQKSAAKEVQMNHPSGNSRYGQKNRGKERAQGYSTRPTSPFYLPESQRGAKEAESAADAVTE